MLFGLIFCKVIFKLFLFYIVPDSIKLECLRIVPGLKQSELSKDHIL